MHVLPAFLFLILSLSINNVYAANNTISIEPYIAHGFGSVWFRMQVTEPIKDVPEDVDFTESVGQSELEYPLDVALGGIRAQSSFGLDSERQLSLYIRAWKNLNNPGAKMEDSDWFGAKNDSLTSLYKFSYTQSRSDLEWFGAEFGAELGDYVVFNKKVAYGFRVAADYSSHKMYGIDGWFKLPGEAREEISDLQNDLVLTYKLFNVEPSIYTKFKFVQNSKIHWSTLFSVSPFIVAKDKDNHVLRNKGSETSAIGFGAGLINQLQYSFNKYTAMIMDLEVRYFRAEGKMDQRFYGDDPGTDEDETGLEFNDIDNVISLFTQQITLGIRLLF